MFKRVITLLFCLLLVFVATFGFVVGVVSVPTIYSYASDQEETTTVPPAYTQVSSNNQLGEGFLAYCKSRDSEITSSTIGASVTAAYNSLAKFCNYAGFNIADLQSHLWYLNENGQTKWFFDSTGINLYNRAFAYLIQENGLEVGDEADVNIYQGSYFVLDDGTACLVYVLNPNVYPSAIWNVSDILQYGSFIESGSTLYAEAGGYVGGTIAKSYLINGRTYSGDYLTYKIISSTWEDITQNILTYNDSYWTMFAASSGSPNGGVVVYQQGSNYYIGFITLGCYGTYRRYDATKFRYHGILIENRDITSQNVTNNVTVNFTTNNNVINNNNYEGDTIINNDGDVIVYPDNPDQPDPGDHTIPYNPYPDNPNYDPNDPNSPPGTITTPINPTDPNGGDNVNIDFPDFDLDLPQINWSLGDLSQKFPFSIPFDMVSLVRVLDAPAEAPRFQGTVNFGFTTWDYDINLEQFSSVAAVCRIVETLLFVFGLILITRNLIKG